MAYIMPDSNGTYTVRDDSGISTFEMPGLTLAEARKEEFSLNHPNDPYRFVDDHGHICNIDDAAAVMDDDIREDLHKDMPQCSAQLFYDMYCAIHAFKHNGEKFEF